MTTFSVEVSPNVFGQQLDALIGQAPTAIADGVISDSPAFAKTVAGLIAAAIYTAGVGYGVGASPMLFPAAKYAQGDTFDVTVTARYQGQGVGLPGGLATQLLPAAGKHGVRVQAYNTVNDTDIFTPGPGPTATGSGSLISGVGVVGPYNGTAVTEGEFHGFFLRGTAALRDVQAWNTQGDGAHIHAGVGLPEQGNANAWEINRALFQNNRTAVFVSGSDTNVGLCMGTYAISARSWGVDDRSLGGTYINVLAQGCGVWGDGTAAKPASAVSDGGNWFSVKTGREVQASANRPPATLIEDVNWIPWQAGAPDVGVPAWVSGIHLRFGGSFSTLAGGLLLGCYAEACAPAQLGSDALVVGGTWGVLPHGGGQIYGSQNMVAINSLHISGFGSAPLNGFILIDDDIQGYLQLGRYQTSGLTNALIKTSPNAGALEIRSPDNHAAVSIANAATTFDGNVLLTAGKHIEIGGVQVLGARVTGWTAGTGTPNQGAFAAYAGATMSAGYVQAEAQATNDAAKATSQRVLAIEAALRTTGIIN